MPTSTALQNVCVQCGYCCTVRACIHGTWNEKHKRCSHLTKDAHCAIYDEIVEKEKNSDAPMMGSGCSSPLFNPTRDAKIKKNIEERGY